MVPGGEGFGQVRPLRHLRIFRAQLAIAFDEGLHRITLLLGLGPGEESLAEPVDVVDVPRQGRGQRNAGVPALLELPDQGRVVAVIVNRGEHQPFSLRFGCGIPHRKARVNLCPASIDQRPLTSRMLRTAT